MGEAGSSTRGVPLDGPITPGGLPSSPYPEPHDTHPSGPPAVHPPARLQHTQMYAGLEWKRAAEMALSTSACASSREWMITCREQ